MSHIEIRNLTFHYGIHDLFSGLNLALHPGWTGVVGSNGSGKSTLLELIAGTLQPLSGEVFGPPGYYCTQDATAAPEVLEEFCFDYQSSAGRLKSLLRIREDFPYRWNELSFGERRRAQIGCALWSSPEVLLLDEPTNHLDAEAGQWIAESLLAYQGIGVLVSHDRRLLERLCGATLFLDGGRAELIRSDYAAARQERARMIEQLNRERRTLTEELARLERNAGALRSNANSADRKRSKRGLAPGDSDGRFKKNVARLTGKDAVQGRLLNRMSGRIEQLIAKRNDIEIRPQTQVRFWFHDIDSRAAMRRDLLAELAAGQITIEGLQISHPRLELHPGERVGIAGPNGSGKSTLLRRLIGKFIPEERAYLPQELDDTLRSDLIRRLDLLDNEQRGHVFAIIHALGTDPVRLGDSADLSAGELRKLWLALETLRNPAVLILDEPGNHLDLPSLESFEEALLDFPGTVVAVSHDHHFLDSLGGTQWILEREGDESRLRIEATGTVEI